MFLILQDEKVKPSPLDTESNEDEQYDEHEQVSTTCAQQFWFQLNYPEFKAHKLKKTNSGFNFNYPLFMGVNK